MRIRHFVIGGLVVMLAATALVQWHAISQVRAENETLRAGPWSTTAPDDPASTVTGTNNDSKGAEARLAQMEKEMQELPRLRGQLAALRQAVAEAEKIKEENQRLRTQAQTA